jgi:hypothetical protein
MIRPTRGDTRGRAGECLLVDLVVRLHPSYGTGGATGRDILVIPKPQTQVNERQERQLYALG